jgi:hypothetical protein
MTMPGGVGQWLPVVAVSVAALPLAVPVYRARVRRIARRGVPEPAARRWALAEVGMVAGTVPWLWMILTPAAHARGLHLVPLVDLVQVLAGDGPTAVVQVVGNLLVFAAFGCFAPRRWPIGAGAVTLLAAAASVAVEALQYALALGRVTSVDDVLLNAAGAGLAALLSRRWASAGPAGAGEMPARDGAPFGHTRGHAGIRPQRR